jgi:DNA polymerase
MNDQATALTITPIEGEPRILDTDLAVKLGYTRPVNVRNLIKRHLPHLSGLGTVFTVKTVSRGQEAAEFYLNSRQALFIITQAGTDTALEIDGDPWFVAKDVAETLGYANPRKAVADHCKAANTVTIRDGNRGNPNVTIIPGETPG